MNHLSIIETSFSRSYWLKAKKDMRRMEVKKDGSKVEGSKEGRKPGRKEERMKEKRREEKRGEE